MWPEQAQSFGIGLSVVCAAASRVRSRVTWSFIAGYSSDYGRKPFVSF